MEIVDGRMRAMKEGKSRGFGPAEREDKRQGAAASQSAARKVRFFFYFSLTEPHMASQAQPTQHRKSGKRPSYTATGPGHAQRPKPSSTFSAYPSCRRRRRRSIHSNKQCLIHD